MSIAAPIAVLLVVTQATTGAAPVGGASLAVYDAALRYQMHQYGPLGSARIWFVDQGGRDPSRALLARLSGAGPVAPVSASVIDWKHGDVRERGTGRRGVVFSVRGVRWRGPGKAVVYGRVYWGPQSAYTWRDTVLLRGRRWAVARDQVMGQS